MIKLNRGLTFLSGEINKIVEGLKKKYRKLCFFLFSNNYSEVYIMDYDNMCPICFNDFDIDACGNCINFAVTNCNHKFCLSCMIRHSKRKYTCPICRGEFINPATLSPLSFLFHNESNIIEEEEEIAMNNEIQSEIEIDNWYFGGNQDYTQEPLVPRINIVYDASNVSFSFQDENIRNLTNNIRNRNEIDEFNNENRLSEDMRIYRLHNNVYDAAMSIDTSDNESNNGNDDENEDVSSYDTFTNVVI